MDHVQEISVMALCGTCWATEREGSYCHGLGIRYKGFGLVFGNGIKTEEIKVKCGTQVEERIW